MAIGFVVVDPGPLLVAPWKPLRVGVTIVFFESGKACRVPVLAFGLVAFQDGGGGYAALEGFGGTGYE